MPQYKPSDTRPNTVVIMPDGEARGAGKTGLYVDAYVDRSLLEYIAARKVGALRNGR